MSAGGAFGGGRDQRLVPPEKGVFPLNHLHECDLEKEDYISCLKSSGHESKKCRLFSKKYLECHMEKNLMARQLISKLPGRKPPQALTNDHPTKRFSVIGFPHGAVRTMLASVLQRRCHGSNSAEDEQRAKFLYDSLHNLVIAASMWYPDETKHKRSD